ncbi:Osmolarity sensory histidine kinase EnvZ [Georgfuchsia toluolica]|uniref:histidine kinase n=1 Tax=Georgfuchsia toluolica TaxID=424218 RepID=A0A916N851_9PROT|nr:ATP-binding protein [Georgfuchsia toluolica]CAG4882865.1 Osmolarity sensory histidine kinase EnvZ [Georgfuchsia toluolica]
MNFTNRLLPRLFLLLTVMMTVSALSWAALFVYAEQAPRARNFAQVLTSIVNLTRAALVAAAPERRGDLLLDLGQQEGVRIYAAEKNEAAVGEPDDSFLRDVLGNLRNSLGPDTKLTTEHYGNSGVFVLVDIEGDHYWIGLPRGRFDRSRSLQWLGWGVLGALVALLTAAAFVSRLTRPLKRLVAAARMVGEGRYPEPLPKDGPEELSAVATAFNQMTADLDRLDQDRALILAGISHDLRTPLTRLRMGIEMTTSDEATRDGMVADVEEMDRTIGQFLDFARSNETMAHQSENLRALLEEIAEQYRRRGIELGLDLADVGRISVNRATLRRAVGNLLDNATRYAGNGRQSGTIDLALYDDTESVTIEVRDRGPGIPMQETDRLLRPFTRLDDARSNPGGAGLGLAIVDRIARQHSGRVELAPRDGGGLVARIILPRR